MKKNELKAIYELLKNNKGERRDYLKYAHYKNGFLYATNTIALFRIKTDLEFEGAYSVEKNGSDYNLIHQSDYKPMNTIPDFEIVIPKSPIEIGIVNKNWMADLAIFGEQIQKPYKSYKKIPLILDTQDNTGYIELSDSGNKIKLHNSVPMPIWEILKKQRAKEAAIRQNKKRKAARQKLLGICPLWKAEACIQFLINSGESYEDAEKILLKTLENLNLILAKR